MNILSKIGLALVVLIFGCLTMCAIQKRSVFADPNVAPAFEQAKVEAQPLIAALGQYYASHAYYPKSISDVPLSNGNLNGFNYEVWSMFRVYNSLECASRSKDFTGFVAAIPDYEQRLTAFRQACVRGYSNFVLKTPPIRTAWQLNHSVVVYAQFASQDARWSVEWCNVQNHQPNSALLDCSRNAFNESLPAGTSQSVRRTTSFPDAVPNVR
jgi:hypothetical protein